MADHLRLPDAVPLDSRRARHVPEFEEFNRGRHATTLRGILEGLESLRADVFAPIAEEAEEELDAANLSRIVLKITGRFALTSGPFNNMGMTALGSNDDREFYVLTNAQSRALFAALVDEYQDGDWNRAASWREALDNIAEIELYGREDRLGPGLDLSDADKSQILDVVIWPTSIAQRGAEKEAARRILELSGLVGEQAERNPTNQVLSSDKRVDTLQLRVRADHQLLEVLLEHPLVETVRGQIAIAVSAEDLSSAAGPDSELVAVGAGIGVIDDLVIANPWLEPLVVERTSFPEAQYFGAATKHGTQVAGIAAWGEVRELMNSSPRRPPLPIYAIRIAQANSVGEAQIVGSPAEVIEQALRWLAERGVRVAVVPFSYATADNGALPDALSSTIDDLARELDIVVVVASGNLRQEHIHPLHIATDYPEFLSDAAAKVAAPGSAALAVTVGSQAHAEQPDLTRTPHARGVAPINGVSPFSRVGPSRGGNSLGRQKPEFAAFGGNYAHDTGNDLLIDDDPNLGATTLIPAAGGVLFAAASGTSYAAPRVAHEVALVATRYPDASANLLRALTTISGDAPPNAVDSTSPRHSTYGLPDAARVLESGGNRVFLVYEGEIATGTQEVIRLPIPAAFATGASDRELRVALAFDPPVRRSRRHYIAGRMTFQLVAKVPLPELKKRLEAQPSLRARLADSRLRVLEAPAALNLRPPKTSLTADTTICRVYRRTEGGWDPDDEHYHLVVSHEHSPWTEAQKKKYTSQRYAVVVELVDHGRPQVDLHAQVELALRGQARVRTRTDGRR